MLEPEDDISRLFQWTYDDRSGSNLIPAEDGANSLEGIAHAATISAHFLAEGKVRYRAPYSDKFEILAGPPRAGSWITEFYIALQRPDTWAGAAAGLALTGVGAAPIAVFKLLRRISARATGVPVENDGTERFEDAQHGTFDALVEAATPSLTRAHRAIRSRRTTIRLSTKKLSFEFDRETKDYIETDIREDGSSEARGNTSGYSVNNRTGRFFMDAIQRTVPFILDVNAPPSASVALARSLEAYASNRLANSDIRIRYRGTRAHDGRLKNILIYNAVFGFGL